MLPSLEGPECCHDNWREVHVGPGEEQGAGGRGDKDGIDHCIHGL